MEAKRKSEDPLEHARELALQLLRTLDPGDLKSTGPTVRDLFENYMTNHGDLCKSAHRMRQLFDSHLSELAIRDAASVQTFEVLQLRNKLATQIGQPTANRVLEILRATYNKSIKWGVFLAANPCLPVSVFPLESRDRYLSTKLEIDNFFAALLTMRSTTFQNFIRAGIFTAARVSNVQSMRWCDLDMDAKVWRIPGKEPKHNMRTKSGKPILVPLIDQAIEAIEAQRGRHPYWVFPGNGSTGHMVNPARAWKRLLKKAGIENLRIHDLRRTMGSWEANTGAPLHIIQKTLGHTSMRATYIYARLQLDPVREAMVKAANAMLG